MVQWEVAQRICAQPGDLSLLAVSVQYYAEPRLVCRVPASAFRPQPAVDSAVLRLDVRDAPVSDIEPQAFFAIVRAGFGQKRKQLLNSLTAASAGRKLPSSARWRRPPLSQHDEPKPCRCQSGAGCARRCAVMPFSFPVSWLVWSHPHDRELRAEGLSYRKPIERAGNGGRSVTGHRRQ